MSKIFRDKALEQLAMPEQIDRLVAVTSARGWLALLGLTLIVLSGVVWGFFGVVDIQVSGKGILMGTGGIHDVYHPSEGIVDKMHVQMGEAIGTGDIIAIVKSEDQLTGVLTETKVIAPVSGRIVEVKVKNNDYLAPTSPVVSIEGIQKGEKALDGFIYVPAEEAMRVTVGMKVFLVPESTQKEDDGYLMGKVVSVTPYPITKQYLHTILENEEIVDLFFNQGPIIEVKVDLIENTATTSGYAWTNQIGPSMKLRSGIICNGLITIKEEAPFEFLFKVR